MNDHLDPLERARQLFFKGLAHHNAQRWSEAEHTYREALALVPDRVSLLVNLSAVLTSQHRYAEALPLCRRALKIDPQNAEARQHLAVCERDEGSTKAPIANIEQLVAENPADADLHNTLGVLLRERGDSVAALASFERCLALDPGAHGAQANRASALAALGRPQEALAAFLAALHLKPDFAIAGQGLVALLLAGDGGELPDNADLDALLGRAISTPWARPQGLVPLLLARLHAQPLIASAVDSLVTLWPGRAMGGLPVSQPALLVLASHRLLTTLMENALVADPRIERCLTLARSTLISHATSGSDGPPAAWPLEFQAALARQCQLNGYVYELAADEAQAATELRQQLAKDLASGSAITPFRLLVAASYAPLHELENADRLLAGQWAEPVSRLLLQQVREPREELAMKPTIPRLTTIAEGVSRQVREQYEASPYPRWSTLPASLPTETLDSYLQRRLPGSNGLGLQIPQSMDVLVAGCGTGQHPIEFALRIRDMRMLAVDLSLSSLAYAQRMAQRLHMRNIEFAQADILELAKTGRRFDLIDASGVLHHMADPAQGLAILGGLLREDGLLRLGLYSETARRWLTAARDQARQAGYTAAITDMRRFRQIVMDMPEGDPLRQVLEYPDFYSAQECHDLLFHVQEHRFDIPGLASLLADARLDFLGFEMEPATLDAFQRRCPGQDALRNLQQWQAFEASAPDTFSGMYCFWARPRRAPAPGRPG